MLESLFTYHQTDSFKTLHGEFHSQGLCPHGKTWKLCGSKCPFWLKKQILGI